jgi:hypothetical protein
MTYKQSSAGPGGISNLPPTIGMTNRAQWRSGMAPLGRRVPRVRGGGSLGLGNGNGNGGGLPLLPIGVGLALGGLLYLAMTRDKAPALGMAGMRANPGRRQRVTVRSHMRKVPGKRKMKRVKGYSYYR